MSNNGPQVRSDDSSIIHSMHQSIVQRKDEGWLLQSLWSGEAAQRKWPSEVWMSMALKRPAGKAPRAKENMVLKFGHICD